MQTIMATLNPNPHIMGFFLYRLRHLKVVERITLRDLNSNDLISDACVHTRQQDILRPATIYVT